MRNIFLTFIILFISSNTFVAAQQSTSSDPKFNFNFEKNVSGEKLPKDWFKWGTYLVLKDTIAYSGRFSGKIVSKGKKESFGCITYSIPAAYEGKSITLKGFMKTENVKGYAGLLLRIDGRDETLEFDNMNKQKIEGTNDWKEYSITLKYPDEAKAIYVAGIVSGEGTAWFDNFIVTIDGKDLQNYPKKQYKADLDTTFDSGSGITFPTLTEAKITDLEVMGRIWGFLKYHHPEIGKGNYNWDYELFRILPSLLKVNSAIKRDELLIHWIEKMGEVSTCTKCEKTDEKAVLKPNMIWVDELHLSQNLKEKLNFLYNNRFQGRHYYVEPDHGAENPIFKNEDNYDEMTYPDAGFRLLSLYRYWNMIQYYFPYKHITDKDWNTVLRAYIPKFINASNELAYEIAVLHIIRDIEDTHAGLWGGGDQFHKMLGENMVPFKVSFVEDQLVVVKYYNPEHKEVSKVKVGDVITHINGMSVADRKNELYTYHTASNEPTRNRNIAVNMLRSSDKEIEIAYISDGIKQKHTLPLYDLKELDIYKKDAKECYKLLNKDIGYVTLEIIQQEDIQEIKRLFKNTKGIIVDIRNYPSAFVSYSFGSYFMSKPTDFVKFTIMNPKNPGEFIMTNSIQILKGSETYKGKLVVLINEETQSSAEYTSMALRAADNTTIVGSTTAGADGNISYINLPGGLKTAISGIGIYYPDGGETQRVGIVPDVEVKPTIKGIQQGKDEVLEKAIQIIRNEK